MNLHLPGDPCKDLVPKSHMEPTRDVGSSEAANGQHGLPSMLSSAKSISMTLRGRAYAHFRSSH